MRIDLARVALEHRGGVGLRIRGHLEERHGRRDPFGELSEQGGIERARFVACRVKRSDDYVSAGQRIQSDRRRSRVEQLEGGHWFELARQFAEAEIHAAILAI